MSTAPVAGTTDSRFDALHAEFAANLANGADVGASVCVTVEGQTVVDLWGGFADEARMHPWERDTLVGVYSCTKTISALTTLWLADQGKLDLDAPVAKYWPEFARHGKHDVLVRHVMSHSAGLPEWQVPISIDVLYDWNRATALLAAQAPVWPPGTACGYHSVTQGYLIGEVVRHIAGNTLGQVFAEAIARPLDADFYIGLPAAEDHRVAELIAPPADSRAIESAAPTDSSVALDVSHTRTRAWRGAELPSHGGIGNARSMAEIHMLLANGGVAKGKQLLSAEACRKAFVVQIEGVDRMLGSHQRYGLGLAIAANGTMPNANTLYWGGYGGSLVIIDADAHTTFAYAMNRLAAPNAGDMRGFGLAMAMWDALGLI